VFATVILIFACERGVISRWLHLPVFCKLGAWSYSIYMVHLFVIIQSNTLLSIAELISQKLDWQWHINEHIKIWIEDAASCAILATVIVIAKYTYQYIEVPARQYFNRQAKKLI
jgi:peptidoglycan/LPS O-acetylase OafA/YrhL